MGKFKDYLMEKLGGVMSSFALAFAGGSVQRICFYIFHQPKMPDEEKNNNGKVSVYFDRTFDTEECDYRRKKMYL